MLAGAEIRNYPAFHAMPPHMHETPSMNIVLGGGFVERIGRMERRYRRGHISYLPAGMAHSQGFGGSSTKQVIFRPEDSWLDYLADRRAKLGEAPYYNDLQFSHLGDRLLHEICEADGFSDLACAGILLEIVAAFGRNREAACRPPTPPSWLRRVREYLHAHPVASFRMIELARVAERHEVHVAREFRRFYGTSVGDYLKNLRLESAASQLADPRADICRVALDCGFSSHSHLCREFKRRFGVTPSRYRAGQRK